MRRVRVTRSIIPNLFTLMNLFSGFNAIVRIAQDDFFGAGVFILIAGVFDILDGAMARLTNSTSDLGVELDSLCDAVSFGVAPAFMVYQAHFFQIEQFGVLIASLPALAGIYRLARFNVQVTGFEDKRYFSGMPIPAGAITLMSYVIFFHERNITPDEVSTLAITAVTALVAGVMISTIKFDNFPRLSLRAVKERPLIIIFFLFAFGATLATKGVLLFPCMLAYICAGIIRQIYRSVRKRKDGEDDADTLEQPDISPFDV